MVRDVAVAILVHDGVEELHQVGERNLDAQPLDDDCHLIHAQMVGLVLIGVPVSVFMVHATSNKVHGHLRAYSHTHVLTHILTHSRTHALTRTDFLTSWLPGFLAS